MKLMRLTLSQELKIGERGWGSISSYTVESIKISNEKGQIRSAAVLKVIDQAGEVTVMFQGAQLAILLGLTPKQWSAVETMSSACQLFYRPFKYGLKDSFPPQQKLFYTLCEHQRRRETIFVKFERMPNVRKGEEAVPFLKVLQCSLPTPELLKQYKLMNSTDL